MRRLYAAIFASVLRDESERRAVLALGADADLGVGHEPTPGRIKARREAYATGSRLLAHLASYAEACEAENVALLGDTDCVPALVTWSRQDGRRIAAAARVVCSATSERLWEIAAALPCACGGNGCDDCRDGDKS